MSETIQILVDKLSNQENAMQDQSDSIQIQKDELQSQLDAAQESLGLIEGELTSELTPKGDIIHTFNNYHDGTSVNEFKNITDWQVMNNFNLLNITEGLPPNYVSGGGLCIDTTSSFFCDQVSGFSNGQLLTMKVLDGIVFGTINCIEDYYYISKWVTIFNITLDLARFGTTGTWGGISEVRDLIYEYNGVGWDANQTIIDIINDYDNIQDLIHRDFDQNATYGIKAQIDMMGNGQTLFATNKQKYSDSSNTLSRFGTP